MGNKCFTQISVLGTRFIDLLSGNGNLEWLLLLGFNMGFILMCILFLENAPSY